MQIKSVGEIINGNNMKPAVPPPQRLLSVMHRKIIYAAKVLAETNVI